MQPSPTRIEPVAVTTDGKNQNSGKILIGWTNGEEFTLPYTELRFQCPCAGCVDEHTGQRVIKRESVAPDVRVTGVQLVGRYAVQLMFSDGHGSGIYPFEKLYPLCAAQGLKLSNSN